MFERIANGISEIFSDVAPHTFCVPCFLEGLAEGAVIGVATIAVIAALPEALAVAATVGLAAYGVYGMAQLAKNWSGMSDAAKSMALGNIAGSLVGGFAGAKMMAPAEAPPGVQLLETPEGGTVPVLAATEEGPGAVTPGLTNDLPPVAGAKDVGSLSAEEANAPFVKAGWSPPYAEGTDVRTFTAGEDMTLARVHGPDNPQGAWLVSPDDIAGMNAEQIQQYLALPNEPTLISDVSVPAGTQLQMGRVGAQPEFGGAPKAGGIQYQLINQIPAASFTNTRPLQ